MSNWIDIDSNCRSTDLNMRSRRGMMFRALVIKILSFDGEAHYSEKILGDVLDRSFLWRQAEDCLGTAHFHQGNKLTSALNVTFKEKEKGLGDTYIDEIEI